MFQLSLNLLGTPQLLLDNQEIVISHRKAFGLLAYVAVSAERQSREALAALFWPDFDRKAAFAYLRQALWRLKKVLPEHTIVSNRYGVELQQVVVDVSEFQQQLAHCLEQDVADSDHCLSKVEAALELYRGDFMAGFSLDDSAEFDNWQTNQTESLRLQRMRAYAHVVDGYTAQHAFETAIWQAKQWLAFDPLLEEAHRSLMRLYLATGQPNLALQQFELCRTLLEREYNIEPETETHHLFISIRDGAALPQMTISPAHHPAPVAPTIPHNLPAPKHGFVGRDQTIHALREQLQQKSCRLLTIVGPGGFGKTSLALVIGRELLQNFPDGVYFVDLAPLDPDDSIINAMIGAADILLQGKDSPLQQFIDWLREKRTLLILDNFEHLLDQAPQLSDVLAAAKHTKILATSRERLNLREEWAYDLDGLTYPTRDQAVAVLESFAAPRLFIERARRTLHNFQVETSENAQAILEICRMVEGVPLAIELAASWIRMLTPIEIAAELKSDIDFLSSSERNRAARHQSLRAVFQHSWELLHPNEQAAFTRLAHFRSSFGRDAAKKVAGASLHMLMMLADKSFVSRTGSNRYRIPEILRQFGVEKLHEQPDEAHTVRQHFVAYYFTLLENHHPILFGQTPKQGAETLMLEIDNIRQAWRLQFESLGTRIDKLSILALMELLDSRGWFLEAVHFLESALQIVTQNSQKIADDADSAWYYLQGVLHTSLGLQYARLGRLGEAIDTHKLAIPHHMASGQPDLIIFGFYNLALAHFFFEDFPKVVEIDSMLPTMATPSSFIARAQTYELQAMRCFTQRNHESAKQALIQASGLFKRAGYVRKQVGNLINIGLICYWQRDFEASRAALTQAMAIAKKMGARHEMAQARLNLARLAIAEQSYEEALRLFESLLSMYVNQGRRVLSSVTRVGTAHALIRLGQYEKAEPLLQVAQQQLLDTGIMASLLECIALRAIIAKHNGKLDEAITLASYVNNHPKIEPFARVLVDETLAELASAVSAEQFAQAADVHLRDMPFGLPTLDLSQTHSA